MERERRDVQSTCWEEIDAVVDAGGYREGFVNTFLEFRGAVLDDEPLDARGRPAVVNQSNFAKHFGISASTFSRWLGEFAPEEGGLTPAKRVASKERAEKKAGRKDRDAAAQEVRRKVAEEPQDFDDKLAVHRVDSSMWWTDVKCLLEFDDGPDKARAAERYVEFLDQEAAAVERSRDELLSWLTEWESQNRGAA